MPYIKNEDLSSLYKEIDDHLEKFRLCQKQYQLLKNKEKSSSQNRNFQTMNVLFWLVLIAFVSFLWLAYQHPKSIGILSSSVSELTNSVPQDAIENKQKSPKKIPVYAVQIGAFKNKDLSLYSEGFVNFRLYKSGDFNTYSLGNFDNLNEANAFRKELVGLGFKDPIITLFKGDQRTLINTSNLNE